MPEVVNREVLEKLLAKLVSRELRGELSELMLLMGDPPDPNNVPPEYWETSGAALRDKIEPVLRKVYIQQAGAQMAAASISVDWALVNQAAITWASQYAGELIKGVTATSQGVVQTAIARHFENPMTRQELEDMLSPTFGPARAEMIAITEVTRASNEGENEVVGQILEGNPGMEAIAVWITKKDERVCKICGTLNGRKNDDWVGNKPYWTHPITKAVYTLPAHPRCRCGKRVDFKMRKKG